MILNESEWSDKTSYLTDVVIVGAGAAGISLALELERKKINVILLEGGKDLFDEESQDCYRGKVTARDLPYGLYSSRLRFFGGSTNCWAGGCGELDKEDFIYRPWIKNSGWPFAKTELISWYNKAAVFLGLDIDRIRNPEKLKNMPPFHGFNTRILEFTKKVRFKHEFRQDLEKSKSIKVFFGANLHTVNRMSDTDSVESIQVVSFNGKKVVLFGNAYILACGGIENARLLLNTEKKGRKAIGNAFDNLGRFFSDHPIAPCATVIGVSGKLTDFFLNSRKFIENKKGGRSTPFYRMPYELQKKYKTLNVSIQFATQEEELGAGEISAWKIKRLLSKSEYSSIKAKDIKNVVFNLSSIVNSIYDRSVNSGRVALRFQIEQLPAKNNRITLSGERDSVGLRRTKLHWEFSELERHSLNVVIAYTAKCLQSANIGTLKLDSQLIDDPLDLPMDLRGGQHHSGTTRMSLARETGVVDENLKVFDSENLYILGSSVFPTNGWVNPTFTIIALSFRLANHLKVTRF